MIIDKDLERTIVSILTEDELDESMRNTAIGLAGIGLGALGAYSTMDKQPPPEDFNPPTTQHIQTVENPKKDIKPPAAKLSKIPHDKLSDVESYIVKKAQKHGMSLVEIAAFLAQAAHETWNFKQMAEVGDQKYFRKYDPKFNTRTAKVLGNVKPGDGAKFKGRSFLQLTGRYNYTMAGKALGIPLDKDPELLVKDPKIGFLASLWYWNARVKNNVNDFSDVIEVTKYINPNLNGLKDRKEKYEYYANLFDLPK